LVNDEDEVNDRNEKQMNEKAVDLEVILKRIEEAFKLVKIILI
jgi:hypothetical protein